MKSITTHTRDTVVVGCSAGGVEALPRILQQLPSDLPAAVLIVQHMAATRTPYLVDILKRSSALPVQWAEQGSAIEPSQVIVGPPDVHMLVQDDHIQLARTARENYARPSIDKLFRSAAATRGNRVVGVLLTGMLDDGVSGLGAIREAGGLVVVQDPLDAAYPDRMLPIDAIGSALVSMVGHAVVPGSLSQTLLLEAEIDREGIVRPDKVAQLGPQTTLVCPECHGPMWDVQDPKVRRYRCYLGHAHTARELLGTNAEQVETALWSAIRALNDRAVTLETMAMDAQRAERVGLRATRARRPGAGRARAQLHGRARAASRVVARGRSVSRCRERGYRAPRAINACRRAWPAWPRPAP
jgi:two-component system chemotaxis response regulator CheB